MFDENLVFFKYGKGFYYPYNSYEEYKQSKEFVEQEYETRSFPKEINFFKDQNSSEKHIEELEKYYNIILTNDYREFLLKYNGLNLEYGTEIDIIYYDMANIVLDKNDIHVDMIYFFSLWNIVETVENENEFFEYKENLELKKILPIATSDAGGEIGIGVGEKNNGKIYYWHREHGEDIKLISNSFTEYISAYYLKKSTLNE